MSNYPTISIAKVRTLMNKGRRNPGRPGNSSDPEVAKTSKRMYGAQPGNEDVATLLFYRSAYPNKEKITEFLDRNDLKAGAPVETTPAFYRYRIHKVANFDKDSLKTYRLNEAPDVLVITGSRLSAAERAGKKASSLEFRTRTLKAAGWSVTPESERKKAGTDLTRAVEKLAKLEEREGDDAKRVTKADIREYARIRTALRKKAGNNTPFTEEEAEKDAVTPNDSLGKKNIYKVLIQAARDEVKAAEKRSEKIASAPSGKRGLPEGVTAEMLADYAVLQKKWVREDLRKSGGEIRSYAINKTTEFLGRYAAMRQKDIEAGGTGGVESRSTRRASDEATAEAAAAGEVELPRKGKASDEGAAWEGMKKLATTALRKQGTTAQANVERAAQILVAQQKKGADAEELKGIADDLAFAFKGMKDAGREFATSSLAEIVEFYPNAGEEEVETQENPRRRRPRTAIVPARAAAKWLKLKAVADKVDAAYHKMTKSYGDLYKISHFLGRLKRKRTAQADYARDQLQAERTRVERRLVKETAAYKKAQATYLKAIKAANKKPAKKRSR